MIRTLILLAALLAFQASARAQARYYDPPEVEALLAPLALYPDLLLSHVLVGATYPDDLHAAAAWSRANPQRTGEDAVRAADSMPWHESVKALLAFPDLLYRMDESPQWTADLGAAYLAQEAQVMDSVQELRRRAQAAGFLQPNAQVSVQQQGQAIVIHPAQPQAIYVPYYNPYVVYGPAWSSAYRPVFWRPWYPRAPVFVSVNFFRNPLDWQRRHFKHDAPRRTSVQRVRPVTIHTHASPAPRPIVQVAPPSREVLRVREVTPRAAERRDAGHPHRFERSHPVAVQPPAHPPRAPGPAAQAGHGQPRRGHN